MNFAFLLFGLFGAGGLLGGDGSGSTTGPVSQNPLGPDDADDDGPTPTPLEDGPADPIVPLPQTTPQTVNGLEVPEIDFSSFDRIIDGATFNSTLSLGANDSNTLIINSTFENINGSGITMRDADNITIANSTFRNIDDFGILLRSSGSTDTVTIMGNSFEDIGGDGIHAAKRFDADVDHTNLVIYDNDLHNTGTNGFYYHGIYVQSSEAIVWGNELTGTVGANGISIRGDGVVHDNYVDVTSGRAYGAGIKYFSDHMTGPSKTLVITDNVIEANNLYSGIQLDMTLGKKPGNIEVDDWVVNDFVVTGNDVEARNDYVVDSALQNAPWASIRLEEGASNARALADVIELPLVPVSPAQTEPAAEDDVEMVAFG